MTHACVYGFAADKQTENAAARLAQLVERKALNLVVVGSSPTVGVLCSPPNPSLLPS